MDAAKRDEYYKYWKRAVTRTFDWFDAGGLGTRASRDRGRRGSAPPGSRRRLAPGTWPTLQADVLVIGGGATGAGVAWDAALRGFDVVLVDRARPRRGHERPLPRAAALGRPLRGQGSGGRRGVRGRERDPAPGHPRLHRGHRRAVRHHARRRPRLRRPLPGGLPRRRAAGRGDRRRRGAAHGAAAQPRHQARVHRPRRVDRRLEDGLVARPRRRRARRARPHLPRVVALHADGDAVTGARVRNELSGEELDIERRLRRSTRRARGRRRSSTWPGSRASA